MDQFERMRRLNELTKELKQRGFADSSFDAINQARQIYGDDELSENVKHGLTKNANFEKTINGEEIKMSEADVINMNKKIEQMNKNVDTLTGKLNEIIKAINDMDARINALKNAQPRVVERIVEREPRPEAHQEAKQESTAEEEKPKGEYNERVGNFKSSDVQIEKMFYYGNKK